jgi:hypothetical protein
VLTWIATVGVTLVLLFATPAFGCSVAMCLGGGPEVDPQATIEIIHQGSPLSGATVTVSRSGPDDKPVLTGRTGAKGKLDLSGLTPGEYWLSVDFLGITAALHCFHIDTRPSWRAKRKLKYEWGDWPTTTLRIAGELIDSQPGTGGNALKNQINRNDVPLAGAEITLHNPRNGEIMRTSSAEDGSFALGDARDGIYVLRIAGGKTGRAYEPTSLVVELAERARLERLRLERVDDCGGPSLRLVSKPR